SETMPPAVPAETGLEEAVITAPADDSLTLLGNTGSLVFHTSDCNFSKSKHCTEVFTSREKAIQEGYKPCGICNP
ncbi:MAG: hypothetical protein KJ668_19205, partial [Proteobacteria bacterium]|nr:hypothetical protein [Pseudomonadota bacterium]